MSLHTVRPADHQDCIIKHLQCPLHLSGKIHMARGIQKCHLHISQFKYCLFGKNSNTSFPLKLKRIQKCILMIYPPHFTDCTTSVQNTFRQCGFSRIYMGQNPNNYFFHDSHFPYLFYSSHFVPAVTIFSTTASKITAAPTRANFPTFSP